MTIGLMKLMNNIMTLYYGNILQEHILLEKAVTFSKTLGIDI